MTIPYFFKQTIVLFVFVLVGSNVFAQEEGVSDNEIDSLYIVSYEEGHETVKVLHAEPLYIDLIRDLGARKGEAEWNVGLGLTDNLTYDTYEMLVEYEFAPVNRLGFEFELPFLFYSGQEGRSELDTVPSNKMESFKLGAQWSFFVNEKIATSMALGYINEFEFSDFDNFGNPLFVGNVYNPFVVVAKRWGNNFHTLIYTGPVIEQTFKTKEWHSVYEMNTSFHYMISGTSNFIGVEFNKSFEKGDFDMTMRPQMRIGIKDDLLIGIVVGIPVSREEERLSTFLRLIWEPSGHHK